MSDLQLNRRALLSAGLGGLCSLMNQTAFADLIGERKEAGVPPGRRDVLLPSQLWLGQRLAELLARSTDANVMVSPASLTAVLAMLSTGANRPLQLAIHQVLGFDGASHRMSTRHMSGLKAAIGHFLRQANGESPLALANMIIFDPASKPDPRALAKIAVEGADVSIEDLRKTETIQRVNEWVAQRTRNLIPSILGEPLSHPGLVAVNALYFKDKWRMPFDPAQTRTESFHLVGGKSVDASMMYSPDGRYRFRQDGRFIAAELSYASDDFKLVVVTTKARPARAHEFARVAHWLGADKFIEENGLIALPRLAISGDINLLKALDAMGLAPERLRHDAFRKLTAVPQRLSRVVQKTKLKFDEEGTEAAAATAAATWRSSSMDNYIKMVVDKPFVFALRNHKTGLVLLSGYVADVGNSVVETEGGKVLHK